MVTFSVEEFSSISQIKSFHFNADNWPSLSKTLTESNYFARSKFVAESLVVNNRALSWPNIEK